MRGFTLIELMVAVSIFAIVMMVGVGALLTMVSVNKRAQGINSVMNNLNAAVEQIARATRVGSAYHCAASPNDFSNISVPADCAVNGGLLFAFEATNGNVLDTNDQVVYRLNGTQLERSLRSGINGTWVALTSPEVHITSFKFYVTGSTPLTSGDSVQPRLLMIIHGTAELQGGPTDFVVQSSVTQRLIDL
ncbi:MAG: prepilin-type N-terminal cleavage/methylation domain-containing protein [Patescibacteria group bacterium]